MRADRLLVVAIALAAGAAALAQTAAAPAAAAAAEDVAMTAGEVRKVDRAQGKVTLRHGPIVNLDMPAMTMVFRVTDPAMLDALKAGDKVQFVAAQVDGAIAVTRIQPAR